MKRWRRNYSNYSQTWTEKNKSESRLNLYFKKRNPVRCSLHTLEESLGFTVVFGLLSSILLPSDKLALINYGFLIFKLPCEVLLFFLFTSKLTFSLIGIVFQQQRSLFLIYSLFSFFHCPMGFVTLVLKQETESSFTCAILVSF